MIAVDQRWLAWAAGLYEGEGSCSLIHGGRRRLYPQLCLASTDRDVVYRFHSVVGFGGVVGPYVRVGRKPFWHWRGHGWEAVRLFLTQFGPYLAKRPVRLSITHKSDHLPEG
jgi:hypothetical protein